MPRGKTTATIQAEKAPTPEKKSIRARSQPERLTESAPSKRKGASKGATKKVTKTAKTAKSAAASKGKEHAPSPSKQVATKKRTSSTRRATKGSKRSFPSMVVAAIGTLHHRGGSSYQAIGNFIAEKHPEVARSVLLKSKVGGKQALHTRVMRALRRLVEEGQVDRHGHSYRLTTKAKHASGKMSAKTSSTKTSKTRKVKKEKDPNKPKRPLTAFMFFSKDVRATVKAEEPSLTFGEIGTAIAAKWAKVTPAEKKKYEAHAAKDKVRYETAMKSYVPPAGSAAAKKAEKLAKPKRPTNAYQLFQKDEMPRIRAANAGVKQTGVLSLAAAEWRKLTAAEKKPWEARAVELKKIDELKKKAAPAPKKVTPTKKVTPKKKITPKKAAAAAPKLASAPATLAASKLGGFKATSPPKKTTKTAKK